MEVHSMYYRTYIQPCHYKNRNTNGQLPVRRRSRRSGRELMTMFVALCCCIQEDNLLNANKYRAHCTKVKTIVCGLWAKLFL